MDTKQKSFYNNIQSVYSAETIFRLWGRKKFQEYSGLSVDEIDQVIDSYTNPLLFEQDENGDFRRDSEKNLILKFKRS